MIGATEQQADLFAGLNAHAVTSLDLAHRRNV